MNFVFITVLRDRENAWTLMTVSEHTNDIADLTCYHHLMVCYHLMIFVCLTVIGRCCILLE